MRDLSTLPKVESHLLLEGTLEPETVLELARRNKVELPYADLEDLRDRYGFTDLVHDDDALGPCLVGRVKDR
jgi:adenosine deaminase